MDIQRIIARIDVLHRPKGNIYLRFPSFREKYIDVLDISIKLISSFLWCKFTVKRSEIRYKIDPVNDKQILIALSPKTLLHYLNIESMFKI